MSVNVSNLGGSSWYVLSSSKSKDRAIDFLNATYGSDIEFYQDILFERGAVGSYIPSQSGSNYTKEDESFGGQKIFSRFSEPEYGVIMLAIVIATLPTILIFFLLQKRFVEGMLGSVK